MMDEINSDMLLEEMAGIAFCDVRDYFYIADGVCYLRDTALLSPRQAAAIAGMRQGVRGAEIQLHDKMRAISWLSEKLCFFMDGNAARHARDMAALREALSGGDMGALPFEDGGQDDQAAWYGTAEAAPLFEPE